MRLPGLMTAAAIGFVISVSCWELSETSSDDQWHIGMDSVLDSASQVADRSGNITSNDVLFNFQSNAFLALESLQIVSIYILRAACIAELFPTEPDITKPPVGESEMTTMLNDLSRGLSNIKEKAISFGGSKESMAKSLDVLQIAVSQIDKVYRRIWPKDSHFLDKLESDFSSKYSAASAAIGSASVTLDFTSYLRTFNTITATNGYWFIHGDTESYVWHDGPTAVVITSQEAVKTSEVKTPEATSTAAISASVRSSAGVTTSTSPLSPTDSTSVSKTTITSVSSIISSRISETPSAKVSEAENGETGIDTSSVGSATGSIPSISTFTTSKVTTSS